LTTVPEELSSPNEVGSLFCEEIFKPTSPKIFQKEKGEIEIEVKVWDARR